jgi:hypothetical protein
MSNVGSSNFCASTQPLHVCPFTELCTYVTSDIGIYEYIPYDEYIPFNSLEQEVAEFRLHGRMLSEGGNHTPSVCI